MPATRSGRKPDSAEAPETPQGTKRKAGSAKTSPATKDPESKKQKSLEETMPQTDENKNEKNGDVKDEPMTDDAPAEEPAKDTTAEEKPEVEKPEEKEETEDKKDEPATAADGNPVEKAPERADKVPSSILEKGIIYFFMRPRVGIEEPESVADLQRTFFVMRPLPHDSKLGDGAMPDEKVNRLIALPKKTLPKSHSDRFMAFVEKANTGVAELKEEFMQGSSYETKTSGTRTTQPVSPVGEGVYAITHDEGRSTHLAYMLTIPQELGEIQNELGLRAQGSFVMSIKNPERKGPANAQLPQGPDFPKEIIEEMRGLAWAEVRPSWLDYANVQMLLIGEGDEQGLGKAVEQRSKDQKHDKETPQEEMEKLEHEDELRVEHLHGDNTVFDDLKISSQDYPKVQTTW